MKQLKVSKLMESLLHDTMREPEKYAKMVVYINSKPVKDVTVTVDGDKYNIEFTEVK